MSDQQNPQNPAERYIRRGFASMDIIGNLGADPILNEVPSGTKICRLRVAVNSRWRAKGSKDIKETVSWFTVIAFNGLAAALKDQCYKGQQVHVVGKPQNRSVTKDGKTTEYFELVARQVDFLTMRNASNSEAETGAADPDDLQREPEDNDPF